MWNPFKRTYNANAQPMKLDFIPIFAVVVLAFVFIWALSYLFGIGGVQPVGPILTVLLFAVTVVLAMALVKQKWQGQELSKMDIVLVVALVVLLIFSFGFLPSLAPDLFAQSLVQIKTQGLQAFVNP